MTRSQCFGSTPQPLRRCAGTSGADRAARRSGPAGRRSVSSFHAPSTRLCSLRLHRRAGRAVASLVGCDRCLSVALSIRGRWSSEAMRIPTLVALLILQVCALHGPGHSPGRLARRRAAHRPRAPQQLAPATTRATQAPTRSAAASPAAVRLGRGDAVGQPRGRLGYTGCGVGTGGGGSVDRRKRIGAVRSVESAIPAHGRRHGADRCVRST